MDPGYFAEAVLLMIDGSFTAKFREEAVEGWGYLHEIRIKPWASSRNFSALDRI
jgi:hypothetical protein